MSEQTEALNFGPQWIRDLSNGTSVTVPPPSPGPSYKLAQYRYGKEEMLALYSKNMKPPEVPEDIADFILTKEVRNPLAMMPLTEEEQHNSLGSLNSLAVLKMMGRGGQRGGRGMSRGARGSGRGQPGFYRGFSQDDSSKPDEGRPNTRKTSWGDNAGRGGFGDRSSARDTETSPRGFEPAAVPGRHGRALASGNWRSSESGEADDDGGGWITSGSRGSERTERWKTSSRDSWHRDNHSKEAWNRSWSRDHDKNSFEDLPEWSKSDNVFEPDLGSFDDTGAFCITKDKTGSEEGGAKDDSKEDWDLEIKDDDDNTDSKVDLMKEKDSPRSNTTSENDLNVQDVPPADLNEVQQEALVTNGPKEDDNLPVIEEKASDILTLHSAATDEVGANLERVAESCIANLDVENEEAEENRACSLLEKPVEETSWFYRDPQGLEQGPFSSDEMIEWFHHGYFTMSLSVRRHCDAIYLSLGELIKRWKRVPFMPGPNPPPITRQQVVNEQTMLMQQQLLQQHYQHLQKQAILLQIQAQQQHLQQQEELKKAAESSFRSAGPEVQPAKSSWSPTGEVSFWDEPVRKSSPVPSVEEIRRHEREKEIQLERERVEAERKEAEMVALREKEDEERREVAKKQEEERKMAEQKQEEERQEKIREEEIRKEQRRQEELALKQKAENEKRELARRQEMERRKQLEAKEKFEAEKHKRKEKERRAAEGQKILEEIKIVKIGKEELQKEARIKNEEALLRKQTLKQETNMKTTESNQQKSSTDWSNGSSRWASQVPAAMSLSEIQHQEERNRQAHEQKMRELEKKQRQLQTASLGWSEKLQAPCDVRSLKAIQDEQARQPSKQQNSQLHHTRAPQASTPWSNTYTAGNNNLWTRNDKEELRETEFWDDVMRAQSTNETQKASTTKKTKQSATVNGKKSGKKASKEEESVRRIFQETTSSDPFMDWCAQSLRGLATAVDVPTFVGFLKDLESPYEVHTYVREYIGESKEAKAFAKEFIERRRGAEWKHVPTKSSTFSSSKLSGDVVARGGGAGVRSEAEGKTKKKKKQRMQKVDPSILGFSVNAAERVNMGEIQSIDDPR